MMFPPEMRCSAYAIVVDNCRIPTKGLLQRIRNREMMELSASRWDPTPAATTTMIQSNSPAALDEQPTPINLAVGPKVPLRQISPPAQKRDSAQSETSLVAVAAAIPLPTSLPCSPSGSPSDITRKGIPNKPVRSRSPKVQPRSLLVATADEEGNSSSSSLESGAAILPMSPMLPSRHHRSASSSHGADAYTSQQRPRMPQRKSSLLKQEPKKAEEAAIRRLLRDDEDEEDDQDEDQDQQGPPQNNGMDTSNQSIVLTMEQEGGRRQSLTRRPSLPARQSSFEILPATLPTRQSSFELRHRGASPLSEKAVMDILHHHRPLSPERSQSSASMPNLPRRDLEGLEMEVDRKLHVSLPNLRTPSLETAAARQRRDREPSSIMNQLPILSSVMAQEASPKSRSQDPTVQEDPSSTMVSATEPQLVSQLHPTKVVVETTQPDAAGGVGSSTTMIPTTPMPRKPIRQGSFNSQSSAESSAGSSSKARRFRRYRQGATRPSLPVRNSSFDYGDSKKNGDAPPLGKLPGRQSSFPGLHSTFQKL